MTTKQFFQSKAFRCIAVLLCIALISGGLLAILNDVWKVSDEEIINRAIKELCGDEVKLSETIIVDETYTAPNGKIDAAYKLSNNSYLIQSTGNNGFHSGTVSVYVLANSEGVIQKVSIAEYASSQTLMSKFTDAVLAKFKGLSESYTGGTIASGATYSSKAVQNGVNNAIDYLNKILLKEVA